MFDCLIIGGGVIGLSLAYELARRSQRVCVLDRVTPGQAASWAGAGMLPPASPTSADTVEQFCHLSNQLHVEWAVRLREETSIDTGYRQCGAVYVARDETSASQLHVQAAQCKAGGVRFIELSRGDAIELEPALNAADLLAVFHVPDECQLRNPRYLKALEAACVRRGVQIVANAGVEDFLLRGDEVYAVETPAGTFRADQYCLTSGAWTAALAARMGVRLSLKPIRGQIALVRLRRPVLARIINEGPRYLVPRDDGRVLIGSTMEDVGFDTSTKPEAIDELMQFAQSIAPVLAGAELEATWAGLRPASIDGNPYLGRLLGLKNCFIAAGHTRSGLVLSPATAVVMADLIGGEAPRIDLAPFRIDR